MHNRQIHVWFIFATLVLLWSSALAQDAVPGEILQRTFFVKVGDSTGTAFTIDYQGKMYLVTARHVVSGLPTDNAKIQVWQENQWKDYQTVKTLFPPSNEVDIAVFETNEKVEKPYWVTVVNDEGGVTMGQQIWFLGYPWGIFSRFKDGKTVAPFIKRGTMSAIDGTNSDAIILYIDGFNNPGFSGGPILFWDFSKRSYQIVGVVKGYREDTAKVLINDQHVNTNLLVNSGILVGYSIRHAIDAIQHHQTKK